MSISLYIAIGIIVIIIAYMIIQQILNKRAVNELDQNEFHKGLRKAQVIDVREKVDYDYGHINGARNIPITVFKQRYQGLRNDQPISKLLAPTININFFIVFSLNQKLLLLLLVMLSF